jgi:fluoride exporter
MGAQEFFIGRIDRRAERQGALRIFLLVLFGSLGTLARYALGGLIQRPAGPSFPLGTLTINLSGCFLLGCVGQLALLHLSIPPDWRIGITVGFFGAFTTFSTFSWEGAHLLEDGDWLKAALYVGVSVVGGLILALAGMHLADFIS